MLTFGGAIRPKVSCLNDPMSNWQPLGSVALRLVLSVDGLRPSAHILNYPATASVLSTLPRNPKLPRNSRAVSAHGKESTHG